MNFDKLFVFETENSLWLGDSFPDHSSLIYYHFDLEQKTVCVFKGDSGMDHLTLIWAHQILKRKSVDDLGLNNGMDHLKLIYFP